MWRQIKWGESRDDISALDRFWFLVSKKKKKTLIMTPKLQPFNQEVILKIYRFWAGVWNCQILSQVVEPQRFTSLWKRYHLWLSVVELNQIWASFSFLFQDYSCCLTAGKPIFEIVTKLAGTKKKTSIFTFIIYGYNWVVWTLTLTQYTSVQIDEESLIRNMSKLKTKKQ